MVLKCRHVLNQTCIYIGCCAKPLVFNFGFNQNDFIFTLANDFIYSFGTAATAAGVLAN